MKQFTRRDFLNYTSAGIFLSSLFRHSPVISQNNNPLDVIVVKNGPIKELARKMMDELGGIQRFVKKGQTVLIKPNIGWDRLPEQAANTNPELVAEVVKMCLSAGAKRVRVLDRTCNQARRCYKRSGIEEAASEAGAQVRHIVDSRFQKVDIPDGKILKSWEFYKDVLDADVFINVPIAKHHTISRVTLGMKNIMGLLGGDRGSIHTEFMTKIVDVNTVIKPQLTIIDAYRVLMRNGPSGGNLADVEEKKTLIAGVDPVAVDSYAMQLFSINPNEIEYLKNAEERGLGTRDWTSLNFKEINL